MTEVLDHGYLKHIEHWGSDERIIESARMSTAKGFLGWGPLCIDCISVDSIKSPISNEDNALSCTICGCGGLMYRGDEKLLRFLWENKHCYDADTEVLVHGRGFIRWPDVCSTDALGCYDPETDSLVYEVPRELTQQAYRGEMYCVDHGGVDLLVTPEHRMLVKTIVRVGSNEQGWSDVWRLVRADELGDRSMVRYRKHVTRRVAPPPDLSAFPQHDDPRELLRLFGFFLGDGFAGRGDSTERNQISFHLRKRRKINWLAEVCAGLGWDMEELSSVVVRAPGVTKAFRDQFYDENGEKRVPQFLLDLTEEDAASLLDGLRNSDGSEKRSTWSYSTTSTQLAQAIQLIALHAGQIAHFGSSRPSQNPNHKSLHRLMVLSRMREPVINQGKKNTSRVQYDGTVYCAHTRTGVLVVRRNGKVVLSGNSTPFEMAGLTVEVKAPIMVFREWHRHRVPFGYNEMSARYVPLPNENYSPTIDRIIAGATSAGGNKQAQSVGGKVPSSRDCLVWLAELADVYEHAERVYQMGLSLGVTKELARLPVPVARYSCMRATANLRGWLAFLSLRAHPKAQWEIQQYAEEVARLIAQRFPRTFELWEESRS